MRNVVKYIMQAGLVVCLMLFFLVGCDKENDFYEVGRQPVFLTSPENESLFILIWLSDLIMNLQERR